jgi:hypothetical protein
MKKWVFELNREFSKEAVQMVNKYMKRYIISLAIKKCKSKDFVSRRFQDGD